MITIENLPKGYIPCSEINLCSNLIVGGGHLFEVEGALPLLIGVGEAPMVWLQARIHLGSNEFVTIVSGSVSTHPRVQVTIDRKRTVVKIDGKAVITVESIADKGARVRKLDLRPIGLNIHGNTSELYMGSTKLSRNTFSQVRVAFGVGP